MFFNANTPFCVVDAQYYALAAERSLCVSFAWATVANIGVLGQSTEKVSIH